MRELKNIKDVLWDEDCTGVEEYLLRKEFYLSLTHPADQTDIDFIDTEIPFQETEYFPTYNTDDPHWESRQTLFDSFIPETSELYKYSINGLKALTF